MDFLDRTFTDEPFTTVLEATPTDEYPWAWTVKFDSREYLDTGDPAVRPFLRIVIVPKNGATPYFPPTHWSTDDFYAHLHSETPPTGA